MKILVDGSIFALQSEHPQGIYKYWRDLLPRLTSSLPDDDLFFLDRKGSFMPQMYYIVLGQPVDLGRDSEYITGICEKYSIDAFIPTYYSWSTEIPTILTIHDMVPEILGWDFQSPEWYAKKISILNADRFVAVSKASLNSLFLWYGVNGDRTSVVYPPVYGDLHPARLDDIVGFEKKYGIAKPYVLVVGSRRGYKNGMMAFVAMRHFPEYQVVVVGSEAPTENELAAIGDPSRVVYVGYLSDDELSAAYSGARCLLYLSLYEGYGSPVVEAMACGCPVISGQGVPAGYEVGNGAVYVIHSGDEREVVLAFERLDDERIRSEMIDRGCEAVSQLSWDSVVDAYRKEIGEL